MTPISASDIAESLARIPKKHADTVVAHLASLSPGAADQVRERLELSRQRAAGVELSPEANEKGRLRLASGGRSRRLPDTAMDALCEELGKRTAPVGFNDLFDRVHDVLKARNAVGGGEEMLRLRVYEKLQTLVTRGQAEKLGKTYLPTARTVEATSAWLAEHA